MALNARQLEGVGTLYPIAACRHHDLVVAIEGEVKRGRNPPSGRSPPSEKRVGRRSSPVGFMSSRLRIDSLSKHKRLCREAAVTNTHLTSWIRSKLVVRSETRRLLTGRPPHCYITSQRVRDKHREAHRPTVCRRAVICWVVEGGTLERLETRMTARVR